MNIDLFGKTYQMTTSKVIDQEAYMYLQDQEKHLYKKSVNDIVLLLYQKKARDHFQDYERLEDFQQALMKVDLFLSDLPTYQYIKKTASALTINQQQLNQTFSQLLKEFQVYQQKRQRTEEALKPITSETSVAENTSRLTESVENKQQDDEKLRMLQGMSENELLFQLQMHPNSPDNPFIRTELENRASSRTKDQHIFHVPSDHTEQIRVKKMEKLQQMRGFVMNGLLSFLIGVIVGVGTLVLINLIIRLI